MPIVVNVDLDTFTPTLEAAPAELADDLIQQAIEATPLPGDGRPPLDRLESP